MTATVAVPGGAISRVLEPPAGIGREHAPARLKLGGGFTDPTFSYRSAPAVTVLEDANEAMKRTRKCYNLLRRYREIAMTLARHGLGYLAVDLGLGRFLPFHRGLLGHLRRPEPYTRAEHLRLALEELGPTFIKLGQILSTRPDLIPLDLADELAKLQDHAPPVPWAEIRTILEREFEGRLQTVFRDVDPQPLAAASIAQVHRATLADGAAVVVKVRRPGVQVQVRRDLEVLRRLARVAARRPWLRRYDPEGLVEEFAHTLLSELDYARELRNLERLRRDLSDEEGVRPPRCHPELSTAGVLTLEYIDGLRIDDVAGLKASGIDRAMLAKKLARVLFRSTLERGFFHADPHPGNFRVLRNGELVLLDFGMMGTLNERERWRLLELVLAVVSMDATRAADRLTELGVIGPGIEEEAFEADLDQLFVDYVGIPLGEMPVGDILQRFLAMVRQHRLRLPPHLAILAKTILMAEGIGVTLDPDFELTTAVRPLVRRALLRRFGISEASRRLQYEALDVLALAEGAPGSMRRLLGRLERGELQLGLANEDRERLQQLARSADRLRRGVLLGAFTVTLAILAQAYRPAAWDPWAGWIFGSLSIAFLVVTGYLLLSSGNSRR